MTSLIPTSEARPSAIRPPVGLLLSIGDTTTYVRDGQTLERPVKLDHFRAKPGKLGQYEREMAAFSEHYGAEPKTIEDIHFLSDIVPQVLDIRLLAFSTTGFRGRGLTNFAELDPAAFERRAFGDLAFRDQFEFFPKDTTEVRPELRDSWMGEPITADLEGPDDPRVKRLGIKLVCSLEFLLPEIMGLGRVCRITTSGRRSIRNLYSSVWDQFSFFGGRLRGIPFRLEVRPARTQRFDEKERKYVQVDFFELVLDTPFTVGEAMRAIAQRRRELGEPDRQTLGIESRVVRKALALPSAGEEEQTRDEPEAAASDALLNRIAHVSDEIIAGGGDPQTTLKGVFGVDDPRELSAEDAERYWQMLERAAPAEELEPEDYEDAAPGAAAGVPAARATDSPPKPPEAVVGAAPESAGETREPDGGDDPPAVAAAPDAEPKASAPVVSLPADQDPGAVEPTAKVSEADPEPASYPAPGTLFADEPGDEDDPADAVIPVGRHKGKTLGEMSANTRWLNAAYAKRSDFAQWPSFATAFERFMAERA